MTLNYKKIVADAFQGALVVAGVLAVVINVAPSVNLPASDVAWLVAAAAVLNAVIAHLRPYASGAVALLKSTVKGSK